MVDIEVEDIEIRLLLEAIHARYGYDLRDYAPASMRRRVLAALALSGLGHLGALQHQVLCDREFFAQVLDSLTVRVTEMFRDPGFYRLFRARVVPILRTYPLLRIWHSGCATGEEVYASAILLVEEGLYDRSQLYGTDLSPQALDQAKEGIYSAARAAAFSENYTASGGGAAFASYFTEAYEQVSMREALRRNILFFPHNLVSDHAFGEMQVIFCRNVLIYFSRQLRQRVLDTFAQSLCPGGFLCLGSSERLPPGSHPDFTEFSAEERVYRRGP
jgi:chemotaxis protein methyltransferase CheR